MPARLQVSLSESEVKKLLELNNNPNVPARTRKRAEVLCLNSKGWSVNQIADWIEWAPNTVREAIHRWIIKGWSGLWDAPRSGRKPIWREADLEYIEDCCDREGRTYNSKQLSKLLKNERQGEWIITQFIKAIKSEPKRKNGES